METYFSGTVPGTDAKKNRKANFPVWQSFYQLIFENLSKNRNVEGLGTIKQMLTKNLENK